MHQTLVQKQKHRVAIGVLPFQKIFETIQVSLNSMMWTSLASSYVNLQSHLGRDKIAKPVTDSDWDDVYEFLGRPESADKYEIELPEGLPEEIASQFNDENFRRSSKRRTNLALNAEQVKSLVAWQAGNMSKQHEAYKGIIDQSMEQGESALRQEWGRAYDQNLGFARKAFAEYGGDELAAKMESSGMGNDPDVLGRLPILPRRQWLTRIWPGRLAERGWH
jgi:hypothetical protein